MKTDTDSSGSITAEKKKKREKKKTFQWKLGKYEECTDMSKDSFLSWVWGYSKVEKEN